MYPYHTRQGFECAVGVKAGQDSGQIGVISGLSHDRKPLPLLNFLGAAKKATQNQAAEQLKIETAASQMV